MRTTKEIALEIQQTKATAEQLDAEYKAALTALDEGTPHYEAMSLRVKLDAARQRITTLEAEYFDATAHEIVEGYRTARQRQQASREAWLDTRAELAAFEEEYQRRREALIGTMQRADWEKTDAHHAADHFVNAALTGAPFDVVQAQRLRAIVEPQAHRIALEADQQQREANQRRGAPIAAAKAAADQQRREAVEAKRAALMPEIEARRAERAATRGQYVKKQQRNDPRIVNG